MYRDTKEHVKSCDECQRRLNVRVEEVLHPNLTSVMWSRVCVDVVHMPKGVGACKYLVVAREDVSGWPEARAIRKANLQTVAKFLEEDVISRHGCPTSIVVDGGSENKGIVDELCAQLRVAKHTVTPYHPQANGLVERGHKQIVDGLSKLCSRSPGKWPNFLTAILWADRTTTRKSTGFTPFQLIYGRQCLLPIELQLSTWQTLWDRPKWTTAELLALRVEQLKTHTKDVDEAVTNLKKSRLANKAWFDKKKRLRPETALIDTGNLVLLHDTKLDNQHTAKLADKWGGPYLVHRIRDGGAYVLKEVDETLLEGAYAGNRLKRYWEREPAYDAQKNGVEEKGEAQEKEEEEAETEAGEDIETEVETEVETETEEDTESEGETGVREEENDTEKRKLISRSGFFVRIS